MAQLYSTAVIKFDPRDWRTDTSKTSGTSTKESTRLKWLRVFGRQAVSPKEETTIDCFCIGDKLIHPIGGLYTPFIRIPR